MATSLKEGKLQIQASCILGEGWALPGYFLPKTCYKSSAPITKPGYGTLDTILFL